MYGSGTDYELEVDIGELKKLTDAMLTRYGYDFGNYALSSFKRRIIMVLKKNGIRSVDALIHKLLYNSQFFEQFVNDVTVNTTEMFRDPSFWRLLRQGVFPALNSRPEFNIWHCACSSGEEVLSMAILLQEANMLGRANLFATDINKSVLARAAEARYPLRNLELWEANYRETQPQGQLAQYYRVVDGDLQFDRSLLANVKFKHHDLATDQHFYKFDLILCRNVMIYFNQELQNRVFELLHNSLFLNGYIALGAKESLVWCKIADKFQAVDETEKLYKKVKL